jgi:hypothetical protein
MKVEFTSNPAAPWGQFTISPEDIKETALLNVMFGTASVVRVPMGITGFKQGADGNVESFSVGFVLPQQPQQPQLTAVVVSKNICKLPAVPCVRKVRGIYRYSTGRYVGKKEWSAC